MKFAGCEFGWDVIFNDFREFGFQEVPNVQNVVRRGEFFKKFGFQRENFLFDFRNVNFVPELDSAFGGFFAEGLKGTFDFDYLVVTESRN